MPNSESFEELEAAIEKVLETETTDVLELSLILKLKPEEVEDIKQMATNLDLQRSSIIDDCIRYGIPHDSIVKLLNEIDSGMFPDIESFVEYNLPDCYRDCESDLTEKIKNYELSD